MSKISLHFDDDDDNDDDDDDDYDDDDNGDHDDYDDGFRYDKPMEALMFTLNFIDQCV